MLKSSPKVTQAVLGNHGFEASIQLSSQASCPVISASAFASVFYKMFSEKLYVQLGCRTWPELLQSSLDIEREVASL